jgi:hypothetical protein
MADDQKRFDAPILEDVSAGIAFALAARSYVEEAGLQVPDGDLGFRCSAEM